MRDAAWKGDRRIFQARRPNCYEDSSQEVIEFMEFMHKVKIALIVILSVLLLIIVLQNTEVTETKILFITVKMPLAALLFVTGLIGFALGFLVAGRTLFRKSRKTGA